MRPLPVLDRVIYDWEIGRYCRLQDLLQGSYFERDETKRSVLLLQSKGLIELFLDYYVYPTEKSYKILEG